LFLNNLLHLLLALLHLAQIILALLLVRLDPRPLPLALAVALGGEGLREEDALLLRGAGKHGGLHGGLGQPQAQGLVLMLRLG
jgi:hypothetical protein